VDFRGRVYPLSTGGPNPQGDDVAKSLLTFAKGEPITHDGARWLAIHLAGLFGIDKVPFEERVQWVWGHDARRFAGLRPIMAASTSPFRLGRLSLLPPMASSSSLDLVVAAATRS